MHRRLRGRHLGLTVVTLLVALPAAAWAGKPVVSGQQKLQIKVAVKPARAGAKGVSLRLVLNYTSSKPGGQQPGYYTKQNIFALAKGFAAHPAALPRCRESVLAADNGNATKACPAASKIGHGTVVVNARPTLAKLITGTVTVYNGIDDKGYGGYPKGSGALFLYVKTSIGVTTVDYFHLVNASSGLKLIATDPKPAKPGATAGFTIQQLDLTVKGPAGRHPYLTAASSCRGHWDFSLTTTNYFGQPSVTAHDSVPCTK